MAESKSKKIIDYSILIVASSLVGAVAFYILYNQSLGLDSFYSDVPAHIEMGVDQSGYSAIDILLGVFAKTPCLSFLVGVLGFALLFTTCFETGYAFCRKIKINVFASVGLTYVVVLLTHLYIPYFSPYFDLTGFILQPWHSLTYVAMRCLAVFVMVKTYDVIQTYREGIKKKDWLILTILLGICTWIKPNFLTVYSMALLLFLIYDWVSDSFSKRGFMAAFALGTTVLPAVLIAGLQYIVLFKSTGDTATSSQVAFSITGSPLFKNGKTAFLLQMITGLIFPTAVYAKNIKIVKRSDVFSVLMFLIAFFEILFFSETGARANDNNFYWSVYIASFFLFYSAASVFSRSIKEHKKKNDAVFIVYLIVCILILIWHFLSGVLYLKIIMSGWKYNDWPWIVEPYFPFLKGFLYP